MMILKGEHKVERKVNQGYIVWGSFARLTEILYLSSSTIEIHSGAKGAYITLVYEIYYHVPP